MYDAAIDWAQEHLDWAVIDVVPLEGGMTSAMLALHGECAGSAVLRLMIKEPWRSHGSDLVLRESATQQALTRTPVPAPVSLAVDPEGDRTGHPAHLMSRVPGAAEADRGDAVSLAAMAQLLASIHGVETTPAPRDFQSWAWPTKRVVPPWTRRPATWLAAFELLAGDPPPYEPTFLQRDFGPHNLLWSGDSITGVVDWVETSTGPAWLDVAHGASNLALRLGTGVAQEFAAAYTRLTGVAREPFWEVMDLVGYLPPPGRPIMFDDPAQLRRLEEHLAWCLAKNDRPGAH